MRTFLLSSIAAVGLLAAPAMVQAADQQQDQSTASASQDDQTRAMTQERLLKSLQGAGFTNVTVVDATYLVRAQGPDGNRVMMLIDPPAPGTGGSASGGSGGDQSKASSNKQ